MKIVITSEGIKKTELGKDEAVMLVALSNVEFPDKATENLIQKGYISRRRNQDDGYFLTDKAYEAITDMVLASDSHTRDLTSLCTRLREIYPQGKKIVNSGGYYWTDGIKLIEKRLKIFFKKYGDHYTDEQIIDAVQRYVDSFGGEFKYMSLLKYFIFKEKKGDGGDIESSSELLNYIENGECEEDNRETWTSKLV